MDWQQRSTWTKSFSICCNYTAWPLSPSDTFSLTHPWKWVNTSSPWERPCFFYIDTKASSAFCVVFGACVEFDWATCSFCGEFNGSWAIPPPNSTVLTRLCDCDLCRLCVPAESQFGAGAQKPKWTSVGAMTKLWLSVLQPFTPHTVQLDWTKSGYAIFRSNSIIHPPTAQ